MTHEAESTQVPPVELRMSAADRRVGGCALLISLAFTLLLLPALLGPAPVGPAIALFLPFALGFLSGLLAPDRRVLVMIGMVWVGIGLVVGGLLVSNMIGVFCSAIYAVVAFPPGLTCGLLTMYWRRRRAQADHRRSIDVFLFFAVPLLPALVHVQERLWPVVHAPEHLAFAVEIDAPPEHAFAQTLRFDGLLDSPWEAIAAPLPRQIEGRATRVGDEKTMRFQKGVVRVRVAHVEPGRLVAEVVEQTIERKALLLRTVEVRCEAVAGAPHRTRATLRIDFEPRMGPRWYWRPFERFFGGITFAAILDEWRRAAEAATAAR